MAGSVPSNYRAWALTMLVRLWNGCQPPGSDVYVTEDDGSTTFTQTRSKAWQLGDGTPVVKVVGKSGGYLLTRVKPIAWAEMEAEMEERQGM